MLAHRLDIAEVVILFDKGIEHLFMRCPPNLPQADCGANLLDRGDNGEESISTRRGRSAIEKRIGAALCRRRKGDMPFPVQAQQQATADHIL